MFDALWEQRVALDGLFLKPNMVLPGASSPRQASVEEIAEAVGQTTHLAARMEQMATPGTILLAPATLQLVRRLRPSRRPGAGPHSTRRRGSPGATNCIGTVFQFCPWVPKVLSARHPGS